MRLHLCQRLLLLLNLSMRGSVCLWVISLFFATLPCFAGEVDTVGLIDVVGDVGAEFQPYDYVEDGDFDELGARVLIGRPSAYRTVLDQRQRFGFSFIRYRPRGMDYRVSRESYSVNGAELTDLFTGAPMWWSVAGVERVGSGANTTAMAGSGAGSGFEVRPQDLRRGAKVAYSFSNRTFTNRMSGHYVTHWGRNHAAAAVTRDTAHNADHGSICGASSAWSAVVSASVAGGRSLNTAGVAAADMSLFAAVTHRRGPHTTQMSVVYAPSSRAMAGASTSEAFELTGDNLYNPYWGYDGEPTARNIRNSRVRKSSMPIFLADHNWQINPQLKFQANILFGMGRRSTTALNWQQAPNPTPDYYRNMPSYEESEVGAELLSELWRTDPYTQGVNYGMMRKFNAVNAPRASYMLENRVTDLITAGAGVSLDRVSRNGMSYLKFSLSWRYQRQHNYKIVEDLFGASYWLDVDSFVEEQDDRKDISLSDANNPGRTVAQGDIFGYNYAITLNQIAAGLDFRQLMGDFAVGASLHITQLLTQRTGYYHKANFSYQDSYGRAPIIASADYRAAVWGSYSLGERLFIRASVDYLNAAPRAADLYFSPRFRSAIAHQAKAQQNLGLDISATYRRANFNLTASVYYTTVTGGTQMSSFYDDFNYLYCHYLLQDASRSYLGAELGAECHVGWNVWLSGMFAISDNRYTSNPLATQYLESTGERILEERVLYQGLHCGVSPEDIASVGVSYRPGRWVVTATCNYFGDNFVSPAPLRYTVRAIAAMGQYQPLQQERLASGLTLDLFVGRSFAIRSKRLGVYAGVNNVTNRRDITTSGFQANRVRHDTRYYYGLGINGFINVSLTF